MKHFFIFTALVFATACFGQEVCPPPQDADGNGFIGSTDLIDLLANFGDSDLDGDGIWDSEDECVGEYDECGVCNGEGPQIPVIQNIEVLYDSIYAEQIDEWWVFEVGVDTTLYYVCELGGCIDSNAENYNPYASEDDGSCTYACGVPLPYHGHSYQSVQIGDQCWFAENLRSSKYPDGSDITHMACNDNNWGGSSSPLYSSCSANVWGNQWQTEYLYNHHAATHVTEVSQDICPAGWRLPTGADFYTLFNFIEPQVGLSGNGDHLVGSALKHPQYDSNSCGCGSGGACEGFDAFGFSAIGSGERDGFGGWYNDEIRFEIWAFNGYANIDRDGCEFEISGPNSAIEGGWMSSTEKSCGRSIRCIKDSE